MQNHLEEIEKINQVLEENMDLRHVLNLVDQLFPGTVVFQRVSVRRIRSCIIISLPVTIKSPYLRWTPADYFRKLTLRGAGP